MQDTKYMPSQDIAFIATPPPLELDTTRPTLKVCEWATDSTAQAVPKVTLPIAFRSKWLSDPVRNPQWRDAIKLWDETLQENAITAESAPHQPKPAPLPDGPPAPLPDGPDPALETIVDWDSEPKTTAELASKYEENFSVATENGKGSFLLTKCGKIFIRSGEAEYSHNKMTIIAGCGQGDWVKPPKSTVERDVPMAFPFVIADDTASLVLETKVEGRATNRDTERCALRTLLQDMEAEGFVDIKLHGHIIARPEGAAASDAPDFFNVTPDSETLWVWKARAAKDKTPKSHTTILSWVPAAALRDSPMMEIAWRVNYDVNATTLLPKRVLVFLKSDLSLAPHSCQRII